MNTPNINAWSQFYACLHQEAEYLRELMAKVEAAALLKGDICQSNGRDNFLPDGLEYIQDSMTWEDAPIS